MNPEARHQVRFYELRTKKWVLDVPENIIHVVKLLCSVLDNVPITVQWFKNQSFNRT